MLVPKRKNRIFQSISSPKKSLTFLRMWSTAASLAFSLLVWTSAELIKLIVSVIKMLKQFYLSLGVGFSKTGGLVRAFPTYGYDHQFINNQPLQLLFQYSLFRRNSHNQIKKAVHILLLAFKLHILVGAFSKMRLFTKWQ